LPLPSCLIDQPTTTILVLVGGDHRFHSLYIIYIHRLLTCSLD
jgi:hypothetical protein